MLATTPFLRWDRSSLACHHSVPFLGQKFTCLPPLRSFLFVDSALEYSELNGTAWNAGVSATISSALLSAGSSVYFEKMLKQTPSSEAASIAGLLPTPYPLPHTPYFLLPTSYFLLPTPYSLLPNYHYLIPTPPTQLNHRPCIGPSPPPTTYRSPHNNFTQRHHSPITNHHLRLLTHHQPSPTTTHPSPTITYHQPSPTTTHPSPTITYQHLAPTTESLHGPRFAAAEYSTLLLSTRM